MLVTTTPRNPWYPIRYRRLKPGCARTCTTISWEVMSHDRIESPHRADRCRGRRRRDADARSIVARARCRATDRTAGARLVSLQSRQHRGDGRDRRRQPLQIPGHLRHQPKPRSGECRSGGCLFAAGARHDRDPVLSVRRQHRFAAGGHRHRHRRSELQEQQGRRRAVPCQPEGVRHRPQSGRRRHHLPYPRRPHQRLARRPTTSRHSRMRRSWCRRRSGNTSPTTAR